MSGGKYCVNRNANSGGEHEVHIVEYLVSTISPCERLPKPANQEGLGVHLNCHSAVRAAKKHYLLVDGCSYCCKPCHTK